MSEATVRHTEVLVIGGGMAGAWAALGAARQGARVILVDKGYCGTSGVTATAGPGHWWVRPAERVEAVRRRQAQSGGLCEPHWMHRIIETTWRELPTLARHYRFPVDRLGQTVFRALRGPEYLRALRAAIEEAGVTVLDHHPALRLLRSADGQVCGATGQRRQDHQAWTVHAGAVVLASGGCAFKSKLLGADNNTGDGLLMAAELGAELSGMEFTSFYTVAPVFSSMTRAMSYAFARYFDAAGQELDVPFGPETNTRLARALAQGPVYCSLDRMPEDLRRDLPHISPNVMLPFTRRGIDPYKDRFEITLRGEGTVRGIGGLRVVSEACESTLPGLFVAGDAASRERVAGAISGGGSINSAWALSSGLWAGQAAAQRARALGGALPCEPGEETAGQGSRAAPRPEELQEIVRDLQRPMLDPAQNLFRHGQALQQAIAQLDGHWRWLHGQGPAAAEQTLAQRETTALLAAARWSARAALARPESRGMHQRVDAPETRPDGAHRLLVGGLAHPWVRAETPNWGARYAA